MNTPTLVTFDQSVIVCAHMNAQTPMLDAPFSPFSLNIPNAFRVRLLGDRFLLGWVGQAKIGQTEIGSERPKTKT